MNEKEDTHDNLHPGVRSHHIDRQPIGKQWEGLTAVVREGFVGLEPF